MRAGVVAHSVVFCVTVCLHSGQLNLPPGFGRRPRFLPAPAGATPARGQAAAAPRWNTGNAGCGCDGRPPEPDVGGADGSEAVARSSAGQLYTPSCRAAAAAGAPPPPPPPGAAAAAAAAAGCCCAACRAASTAKTSESRSELQSRDCILSAVLAAMDAPVCFMAQKWAL